MTQTSRRTGRDQSAEDQSAEDQAAEDQAARDQGLSDTAGQLRVAIGAFNRRSRERLGEGDLTVPQLTALSRLDRFGPVTTAELARNEQITPQAMGATVASLESRGLVTRSADATDGRRSILHPTEAGHSAVRSGRSSIAERVAVLLSESFTREEIATLAAAGPLIERLAALL